MQEKTSDLHHTLVQARLTLNKQKTQILKINAGTEELVTIEGVELGEVESFIYLCGVMDKSGGTDTDVKTRIGKVRSAYNAKKGLELQRNRHIHQHTLVYLLTFQGHISPFDGHT